MATIEKESTLGHLTVIIEFPSKEDAVSAYESEEYQKMIPLRTPYSDLTLTIFEGVSWSITSLQDLIRLYNEKTLNQLIRNHEKP